MVYCLQVFFSGLFWELFWNRGLEVALFIKGKGFLFLTENRIYPALHVDHSAMLSLITDSAHGTGPMIRARWRRFFIQCPTIFF